MKTQLIAEIGINHNGDISIAKRTIEGAKKAGADAVKFQKRTLDIVYTQAELDKPRKSPWGTTNREQKAGLEFGLEEYKEIDAYCKELNIEWFASAWDIESQVFLRQFDCNYNKIASAMLGHVELLRAVAKEKKYTYISTAMSTLDEIKNAVSIFINEDCPFELMHCVAAYPMEPQHAGLPSIKYLSELFGCKVGYSGHETGIIISCAAVAVGATSIERHITLDRAMYGSDHSASLELIGFERMVKYIRCIEQSMQVIPKSVLDIELPVRKKLRYYE